MDRVRADVRDLIGRTPLVALPHIPAPDGVRLFAKLESQNPTGSIKDRIVQRILQTAREQGALTPGQPIVEASTGNTGLAVAMLGRLMGHPVHVCVPESVYPEIGRLLSAYGATIHWVPRGAGIKTALEAARALASVEGAFMLDQFGNEENVRVHYETTAVEILDALPRVDAFVAGIGTGGTITGIGRRLREANPDCQVIGVEPRLGVHVQGLTSFAAGFIPPLLDPTVLAARLLSGNRNAVVRAREVLAMEGISVGISSGAVLHAALRLGDRLQGNVVLIFADGGAKYVSTEIWDAADITVDSQDDRIDDVLWW